MADHTFASLTEEQINEGESIMSPEEYFSHIKGLKNTITDEELVNTYENCLELARKYQITGQTKGLKKLAFHLKSIEREREIVKMGINQFVYRDDVEYYIDHVASDVVKVIELKNFEREIPDDVAEIIAKVKDKFDEIYVVFTDYTGEVERQVEKERRSKDPILFGTFQQRSTNTIIDRWYYIADWADEYCDLTLDKMVNETKNLGNREILRSISTPQTKEELLEQLDHLTDSSELNITSATFSVATESQHVAPKKVSKIKTALKGFFGKGEE